MRLINEPIFNKKNIKLFHSDSIQFLKTLKKESVDLVITDPAYSGMNQHLKLGKGRIVGKYSNKGDGKNWFQEFHDDPENYRIFLNELSRVLKDDSHLFIMFDSFSLLTLGPIVREVFNVKNILTWDKVNIGMGHYFRRQSEFIIFASKGKRPISEKSISDIWRIKRIHSAKYPTQKPVELFEAMIYSSKPKKAKSFVVCDPFLGSGSSAIAAINQKVNFIGCDISKTALNVSIKRIIGYWNIGKDNLQLKSQVDPNLQKIFWKK